jgi:hypothetical protein
MYAYTEARSRNYNCRGKTISIRYYECVSVALVIQHAKRMQRVILSSVACQTLLYFSTLSHKRRDFLEGKKVTEHKMCVVIFSTNSVFWFRGFCTVCVVSLPPRFRKPL